MTRMDCREVRDLLPAFDDDELPAIERGAIAQHLQGCPECSDALAELRALRSRIRTSGTFAPPAGLQARVRSAIGIAHRDQKPAGWKRYAVMAASHAIVAGLAALLAYAALSRSDARTATTREVVAAHVRSVLADQLVQVASADTHTVRPWFTGRVPFAPDVVDLGASGFPLLGGRLDYVLDRPAAAIVYGRRKHRINVFVLPEQHAPNAGEFTAVLNGYNVAAWHHGGFAYFATSDLNATELQEFAQALRGPVSR